ncbi:MAG TPA: ATP-binding cassette domain-containing protein [Candidatus Eisenbacteria bacterium]|nr:ATP-binding cassette domain-containing protein [Candidatus Eisenbacteria bacterium]
MAEGIALALRDLTKSYDGHAAITAVTLDVPPRATLALVGPSGSGKSTVLRIVAGLIAPDRGDVLMGDTLMNGATKRALRLRMGYVIQEGGLFPHLTAFENVALMGRELGWKEERVRGRVAELTGLVGLSPEMLARYPAQLSGGQRQRVGIMRALLLDPEVLLLDEPLGALDPLIRARLQEDLRDIVRRLQKTALLVTHDMAEAAYLGDEIAVLRDGRVVQRGTARDLLERPADPFVTEFIRAQRVLEAPR